MWEKQNRLAREMLYGVLRYCFYITGFFLKFSYFYLHFNCIFTKDSFLFNLLVINNCKNDCQYYFSISWIYLKVSGILNLKDIL